MTPQAFEEQLRRLDTIATPLRRHAHAETWRFEYNSKPYFLHFYPRPSGKRSRFAPRGAAAREFANLKVLQEKKVPAVRAVALLAGFRFGQRVGDALITQGVEPTERLGDLLSSPPQGGREKRGAILQQLIALLQQLGKAGLGHADLRLNSFLVAGDKVLIADAVDLTTDGLKTEHLWRLAHDAEPFASRADRVRVWATLEPLARLPRRDRRKAARYRRDLSDGIEDVRSGEWSGRFLARVDRPQPWSVVSRFETTEADWQREWPLLLERIKSDQLDILKRDRSGDVLGGEVTLAGRPVSVVVKRPRNKFWYRYVLNAFRASRAARLWNKARWLQVRHLPVEQPLLLMEKRRFGYVVDGFAVFERVPGKPLDQADLDAMPARVRNAFFFACGRILRRIEDTGLTHTDAKSSNWIVYEEANAPPLGEVASGSNTRNGSENGTYLDGPRLNPPLAGNEIRNARLEGLPGVDTTFRPVLIDAYGIRPLTAFLQLSGIRRLLRAMKNHPQYTPTDSLHLCTGFAPRAGLKEVRVED